MCGFMIFEVQFCNKMFQSSDSGEFFVVVELYLVCTFENKFPVLYKVTVITKKKVNK